MTSDLGTIRHIPSALVALLGSQFHDDITMPDGALYLTDAGAKTLMTDCDAISERGCYLDQSCRLELYAVKYTGNDVLILTATFFNDFQCAYSDALACNDAQRIVNYLFTDYTDALSALFGIANDIAGFNDPWQA